METVAFGLDPVAQVGLLRGRPSLFLFLQPRRPSQGPVCFNSFNKCVGRLGLSRKREAGGGGHPRTPMTQAASFITAIRALTQAVKQIRQSLSRALVELSANPIAAGASDVYGFAPRLRIQLLQNSMDMISYREFRQIQAGGDFLVCQPLGNERNQLLLA